MNQQLIKQVAKIDKSLAKKIKAVIEDRRAQYWRHLASLTITSNGKYTLTYWNAHHRREESFNISSESQLKGILKQADKEDDRTKYSDIEIHLEKPEEMFEDPAIRNLIVRLGKAIGRKTYINKYKKPQEYYWKHNSEV